MLSALADRVCSILNTAGQALQTVTDSLGSRGIIDCVSYTTTGGPDNSTDRLRHATYKVSNLDSPLAQLHIDAVDNLQ
jgi:hypothetical protein